MSTIKKARQELGITQLQMSEMLGIPKRTIENWEEGQRNPQPWVERLIVEKLETMKGQV